MNLPCLKQLEILLPNIQGDACMKLLERVLRNCACVRGRKAFPCLQDQTTILFLLQMSVKRDDIRVFFVPYLEDILSIIVEFIDQARSIDYDFLHSFFMLMIKIECSINEIIALLNYLTSDNSNPFHRALYCELAKYITDVLLSSHRNIIADFFPSLLAHLHNCSRESGRTNPQSLSCSLLMASSLLQNKNCWNYFSQEGVMNKIQLTDMVINWCYRLVQLYSKDSEVGEEYLKVIVATTVALVACSQINKDTLIIQTAFTLVELLIGSLDRQGSSELEDFHHILPYALLSVKTIAINIATSHKNETSTHNLDLSNRVKTSLPKTSSSSSSLWSQLASLLCDSIVNSGLLFELSQTSSSDHAAYITGVLPLIDQDYYLQSLLTQFPGIKSEKIDPSFVIVRQLLHSTELALRVNDGCQGEFSLPFVDLILHFVFIARQEFCEIGWQHCTLKILLDRVLESLKVNHFQNKVDDISISRLKKFLDLLSIIFDGVCIITPISSTSKSTLEDLSFIVGSYLYPSLTNLLSSAHCNPVIIDKVCRLMGKLSARHDREFLSESLDILCCNFSRYISEMSTTASLSSSNYDPQHEQQQLLLFLSHLGTGLLQLTSVSFYLGGGLDCVPPRIETPSKLRYPLLLGLHKALIKLFISLANEFLMKAIKQALQLKYPVNVCLFNDAAVGGLLYLLPAIASTMLLLTPSKENISNSIVAHNDANMITDMGHLISYDIFSLRSFWIHISLFQFHNRIVWKSKLSQYKLDSLRNFDIFISSLHQIAAFTPPLVEFRGGNSIAYLESEMSVNIVAKLIVSCQHHGQIKGKYDWVDDCTGFNIQDIINRNPECRHLKSNIGMILTLSAIQCLETLRIEQFGDIRMIFYYLCDEGIASSTSSTLIITLGKQYFFDLWKIELKRHLNIFTRCDDDDGPPQLQFVDNYEIIAFLLTRCIHASQFVRDLAFYFLETIYLDNPELFWEYKSIFTFLRCLDLLGLLLANAGFHVTPPDYLHSSPWNNDIYLNILPTMEFPGSIEEISSTSHKLLIFGYTFLTQAALDISDLVFPILQEYILLSNSTKLFKSMDINSNIGVAIATEICTTGRPSFHLNPSAGVESSILRRERTEAAAFVSHSFYTNAKSCNKKIEYLVVQPSTMPVKSQYIGEALGLIDSTNNTSTRTNTFTGMELFLDRKNSPSSGSFNHAFLYLFQSFDEIFTRCEENVADGDDNDAAMKEENYSLITCRCEQLLLRGAALLRLLAMSSNQSELSNSNKSLNSHELFSYASTFFNCLTLSLQKLFSHQLVSCVLFVWKWLIGCSPSHLGPLVLSNMISSFQQTVTMNVGLFHRHHPSCKLSPSSSPSLSSSSSSPSLSSSSSASSKGDIKPTNAEIFLSNQSTYQKSLFDSSKSTCQANYLSFEDWIDLMSNIFTIYGSQYMPALFNSLEVLLHDKSQFSDESTSLIARFKLLTFALRIIKASLVPSQAYSISVHRRRLLRERVFDIALNFFSGKNHFTTCNVTILDQEILTLQEFRSFYFDDCHIWYVDYSENFNRVDKTSSPSRGCGPFLSLKFLRSLMGTKRYQHNETDAGSSPIKEQGRIHSLDSKWSTYPSVLETNIIVWLLDAFILHHIDYLIAWRGKRFPLPSTKKKTNSMLTEATLRQLLKHFQIILDTTDEIYVTAIQTAWMISPSLALSFVEKFKSRILSRRFSIRIISNLMDLIVLNPESIRHDWRVVNYLDCISDNQQLLNFLKELSHWSLAPVSSVLNLLHRRTVGYFPHNPNLVIELYYHPIVFQYSVRSLRIQKHQHISTLQFFLPQFVQLLRQDLYGIIGDFIGELAVSSTLLCHQLIWLLQLESVDENSNSPDERHGYCNSLFGKDTMPLLASEALLKTRSLLTLPQREYLDRECEFFNNVTNISAKLKQVKDKDKHNQIIKESLIELGFHPNLYLPTDPYKAVTEVVVDSGIPMQSAAKCPYLLVFHTAPWGGPDSMSSQFHSENKNPPISTVSIRSQRFTSSSTPRKIGIGKMDSHSFNSPKIVLEKVKSDQNHEMYHSRSSSEAGETLSTSSTNLEDIGDTHFLSHHSNTTSGESAVFLKDHSSDNGDSKTDLFTSQNHYNKDNHINLSDEAPSLPIPRETSVIKTKIFKNWGQWKDFRLSRPHQKKAAPFRATVLVGKHTPYPSHTSTASSGKEACIFKVYDDCRQDALTIQIVRMLKDAFEMINLPLYLVPYSVIPNRTGSDHAQGGILQVVANVKSRDQLGKDGAKTLKQHFLNQYGLESSPSYKQAQLEFARSSAGYAIVCYLLSIKDRHNGNILIDNEGHLIHIDFGFLLGISPGGNLGFENAAFKLSNEMIEILGGHKAAEPFRCFIDLTVQGFLVAREIVNHILITVTSMMDSGLPCFLHKDNNLDQLRERFFLDCTNGEVAQKVRNLIDDAANKWTTVAYDGIQKLQNNIYSDSWR